MCYSLTKPRALNTFLDRLAELGIDKGLIKNKKLLSDLTVRATTRSGYVISCNVIGPDRNQNIDLTAKGLSSTEMSQQRALWLGCSLKKSNSM